jgi:hypothetical protein
MDINGVLLKETGNDGKSVFLYYDDLAGLYLAFGLSAYYTTMVTEPYMSYSDELQMPVALLRREHILYLRQSLKKMEHQVRHYYHFEMKLPVGEAGYIKWAQRIRERHNQVLR